MCFLVADTEDEVDEEEGTVVPPPATSDPSLQLEGEGSATDVQSAAKTTLSTPTSISITITTTSKPTAQDSEDNEAPATPALSTRSSNVPSTTEEPSATKAPPTTALEEENKAEEEMEKEEERNEGEHKKDVAQIFQNKESKNAGSVFSPSLLLAGLTGVLNLRL